MRKVVLTIVSVIVGLVILWGGFLLVSSLIIGGVFSQPIGKEKMVKIFDEDHELIAIVTNYLANSGYEKVYIPSTTESGEMSNSGTSVKIDDVEVVEAINTLKKRGYSVIGKDSNTIHFQRWSNLDNGRGIAYSINGNEPTLQFLTKLEPLSEPNWYYYEEDFNEWKMKNEPQE